jgi:hypothetical protein
MIIQSRGEGFVVDMTRTRESRFAMLNFSYRFGSADAGQRKRSQRNQNQQPESPVMMDDF